MSEPKAVVASTPGTGLASRLRSGAGLTRLRAEARLIRRYRGEYRRLLPLCGHVRAIQDMVRTHVRRYELYLMEAALEHERLFRGVRRDVQPSVRSVPPLALRVG